MTLTRTIGTQLDDLGQIEAMLLPDTRLPVQAVEALIDERDRLREAAQAVVDCAPGYTATGGSPWKLDHALDALRDALTGKEQR